MHRPPHCPEIHRTMLSDHLPVPILKLSNRRCPFVAPPILS